MESEILLFQNDWGDFSKTYAGSYHDVINDVIDWKLQFRLFSSEGMHMTHHSKGNYLLITNLAKLRIFAVIISDVII